MLEFKDHIGLVHFQAKLGFKWAQGAGLLLDYDDMFQEASLAFLLAVEGFDPNAGVKFSAYYTRAAFSQFRKSIGIMSGVKNLNPTQRAEITERKVENMRRAEQGLAQLPDHNYGLRAVPFSALTSTEFEDQYAFVDTLESPCASPEEILEAKQQWEATINNLSPLAALVVEWLRDPPPELMKELHCQVLHADKCGEQGVRANGLRDGLTIANIGKFLKLVSNVSDGEIMIAKAELSKLVDKVAESA